MYLLKHKLPSIVQDINRLKLCFTVLQNIFLNPCNYVLLYWQQFQPHLLVLLICDLSQYNIHKAVWPYLSYQPLKLIFSIARVYKSLCLPRMNINVDYTTITILIVLISRLWRNLCLLLRVAVPEPKTNRWC